MDTRVCGTWAGYIHSLGHGLGRNCLLFDRPTRSYNLTAADVFLWGYSKCIGPVHEPMMNCGQLLYRWDIGHVIEDTRELSGNWAIRWEKMSNIVHTVSYLYIQSELRYVYRKALLNLEMLYVSNWQDILCHCCRAILSHVLWHLCHC
jgi:hypothetical protein